jgi:hypothetical protein
VCCRYTSFGELAFVSSTKWKASLHRSASVVAEDRCLLLEVTAADYATVLCLVPSLRTHVEFLRNFHHQPEAKSSDDAM